MGIGEDTNLEPHAPTSAWFGFVTCAPRLDRGRSWNQTDPMVVSLEDRAGGSRSGESPSGMGQLSLPQEY